MSAAARTRQDRAALFANLAAAETQPGRYAGKQKFIDATFARLAGVLRGGAKLEVQNLLVDGDTVVAELASTSISNEGAPFANKYCWVCRFDGDIIAEVRAYLDSAMVTYTVLRNEALKEDAGETVKPAP